MERANKLSRVTSFGAAISSPRDGIARDENARPTLFGSGQSLRVDAACANDSLPCCSRQQALVVLNIRMMLGRLNSACVNTPGMMLFDP
jgi:hypothetical protein